MVRILRKSLFERTIADVAKIRYNWNMEIILSSWIQREREKNKQDCWIIPKNDCDVDQSSTQCQRYKARFIMFPARRQKSNIFISKQCLCARCQHLDYYNTPVVLRLTLSLLINAHIFDRAFPMCRGYLYLRKMCEKIWNLIVFISRKLIYQCSRRALW